MLQRLFHHASHARSHVYHHVAQRSDKAASKELYPSMLVLLPAKMIYDGDLDEASRSSGHEADYSTRCKTKHAVLVAFSQSLSLSLALLPDRT